MLKGLEAFCMALFTRILGWKIEEVHDFLEDVRKEIKDQSIHAYFPM
jgi:hypothetical protein